MKITFKKLTAGHYKVILYNLDTFEETSFKTTDSTLIDDIITMNDKGHPFNLINFYTFQTLINYCKNLAI